MNKSILIATIAAIALVGSIMLVTALTPEAPAAPAEDPSVPGPVCGAVKASTCGGPSQSCGAGSCDGSCSGQCEVPTCGCSR
ncbi:hypothetical protein GF371_02350 [Candidatus Woesearchaeota archaeon]|nr:hypothetical protein [Candidatus Woesearchaeota archaeon]